MVICQTLAKIYSIRVGQRLVSGEILRDPMVRSKKVEMNGLYSICSLKNARKISICGRLT